MPILGSRFPGWGFAALGELGGKMPQTSERVGEVCRLIEWLLEEVGPARSFADGGIDERVRTGLIGSDRDQVFVMAVRSEDSFELIGGGAMLGRCDIGHHTADAGKDVERGPMSLLGKPT